jgi:hypothetical protein
MLQEAQDGVIGRPLLTAAKRVVPWVILGVLLIRVFGMYTQYHTSQAAWDAEQNKPTPSQVASAAAAAASKKPAPPKKAENTDVAANTSKVLVVSDVTLRKDPSTSADAIRDLKTGEQLGLIGQVGPWYKVTDKTSGTVGWVSASDKYTRLVDK